MSDLINALRDFENALRLVSLGMANEDMAARRFDVLLDELSESGWLIPDDDDYARYQKA